MKVLKLLLGLFFVCSTENLPAIIKNSDQDVVDNGRSTSKLLRSVKSDYKTTFYDYNKDSTIHIIKEESNGKIRSERKFFYKDGKIAKTIYKDSNDSESKTVFEYKGHLLLKKTIYDQNEVVAIVENFYDENDQLIKQIEKLEWNNEANKQTRVIDIHKVSGKNELEIKYNGVLNFIVTYDEKTSPLSSIKGYAEAYVTQFYGIANNILSWKRINKNGEATIQTIDFIFDSNGKYPLESTKRNGERVICQEIYSYK